jgi:hypothetical protein
MKSASKLYNILDYPSAPRFAHHRLHLPCIASPITDIRRRSCQAQKTYSTYQVTDRLHDLLISTEDRLFQFSQARPTRQSFLLVRPWDRHPLELPDFEEHMQSEDDWTLPGSPLQDSFGESPGEQESTYSAFLLAQ